ncbi:hypothetical protein KIN20_021737 [Parelaphostrongylus tenuis]|uniref:Uncharacterized protein n=1 Tax=Parelaphostrongylus tenuis TaxID=148309 RepID=A0AAD5N873_PARTN|nr:hypothetical protein KIN20_021737 [Parelaphostrongylus tenuis]
MDNLFIHQLSSKKRQIDSRCGRLPHQDNSHGECAKSLLNHNQTRQPTSGNSTMNLPQFNQ